MAEVEGGAVASIPSFQSLRAVWMTRPDRLPTPLRNELSARSSGRGPLAAINHCPLRLISDAGDPQLRRRSCCGEDFRKQFRARLDST